MSLRLQRVFGARKPLYRAISRSLSTIPSDGSATAAAPSIEQATGAEAQDEGTVEPKVLQDVKPRLRISNSESLAKLYQIGGKLKRAEDLDGRGREWDRFDFANGGTLTFGPKRVPLKLDSEEMAYFPNIWLRDNCRCSKCVNQDTLQRAHDTFSIPKNIEAREIVTEDDGCRVTWDNDGHESFYSWDWIKKRVLQQGRTIKSQPKRTSYHYWGSEIKAQPPTILYDEVMASDEGVGKWLALIRKFGFSFVDGCPVDPHKTQELLERISFIRQTHYGGFYDFTADLTMKDTAYTNLALPAHTDTTYFTDPAGLQMFHVLSHEDGDGGESLLVDGYKAAAILLSSDTYAYTDLAQTPIGWHASGNEGINITPAKNAPVLTHEDGQIGHRPQLLQVRWNNDDRASVPLEVEGLPGKGIAAERWYRAAAKFNSILKRESMEYWVKLTPGRVLIFDNWRVLHGRAAFTGKRRVCGGYINHDDYISRWRNTNFDREQILEEIL